MSEISADRIAAGSVRPAAFLTPQPLLFIKENAGEICRILHDGKVVWAENSGLDDLRERIEAITTDDRTAGAAMLRYVLRSEESRLAHKVLKVQHQDAAETCAEIADLAVSVLMAIATVPMPIATAETVGELLEAIVQKAQTRVAVAIDTAPKRVIPLRLLEALVLRLEHARDTALDSRSVASLQATINQLRAL